MFQKNIRMFQLIFLMMKLNFFWLIFTLAGGVVFGIFPATMSLFDSMRRIFLNKEHEINIKYFKKKYIQNFLRGNLVFLVFIIASSLLLIGKHFIQNNGGTINDLLYSISIKTLLLLLALEFISFFPCFSHFKLRRSKIFLQPFLLIFICPIETLFCCLILMVTFYLYSFFPLLIIALGISLPAYGVLAVQLRKYDKLIEDCV